jgi:BirA family transcriptional regulator, biotin operon repressor / biotin---[acetyl-CoA-carboxylase] ligase
VAAGPLSWQLRRLPVCASTELELARWLEARERSGRPVPGGGAGCGFAVVARRQRFGVGQQGRLWHAPAGGLWLSAAFPWARQLPGSASLGLAVAVGLALQLEALGLSVRLKWPNDLLIGERKLAGLLPRLRLRGSAIRWAQVGVGLNGCNRVPAPLAPGGAISVAEALAGRSHHPHPHHSHHHPLAKPDRLLPRVLAALAWAAGQAERAELVRQAAEARLWRPAAGWLHDGQRWQVLGLHADGRLRLGRGDQEIALDRRF